MDLLFKIIIFLSPNFVFCTIALFWGQIKAQLNQICWLKNIERQGTKVEKASQIGDSFEVLTKSSL
jgi:hypothetical protein